MYALEFCTGVEMVKYHRSRTGFITLVTVGMRRIHVCAAIPWE